MVAQSGAFTLVAPHPNQNVVVTDRRSVDIFQLEHPLRRRVPFLDNGLHCASVTYPTTRSNILELRRIRRVVGRAGQNRRLLKNIAKGTIEAAQRSFEAEKE